MMTEVLSVEAPIHIELLTKRLRERWGLQRAGDRMRDAAKAALAYLLRTNTSLVKKGKIIFQTAEQEHFQVRRPVPGDNETQRAIEHVPPDEVGKAIVLLLEETFSLTENDLLVQVARVFGFDRTGSAIRDTVSAILENLVNRSVVQESGGRLSLVRPTD
jgi:hypothetical protein